MSRPIPVGEIADWLHGSRAVWKALAMLEAYFDESGTHAEAYAASIAGYVATKPVWESVEAGWNDVLAYYRERTPVRSFHAAHCLAEVGQGEFASLDQFHRLAIAKRLSEVLRDNDVWPISCAVIVDDWPAAAPPDFRARYPKPFDLCFEQVVIELWLWARRHAGGEKIAPMFAHQDEYRGGMDAVERAFRQDEAYRQALGPLAFGFPTEVIPLQCADLLAHEFSEYRRHIEYDEVKLWTLGPRRLMLNIIQANGLGERGLCFDAPALLTAIRRFRETGSAYGPLPWAKV